MKLKHSILSRKPWPPGEECHTVKRLFTPDIKRMLKDWLVRRRENPYPSRDEKRRLAYDTGLTYTQISNWFANWRRKLKNNDGRTYKNSWGHLINSFSRMDRDHAIEKQSFSSNDSIWDDEAPCAQQSSPIQISKTINAGFYVEHESEKEVKPQTMMTTSNPKYKQKIMEKYLRDTSDADLNQNVNSNPELSKWLESAEKFTPEKCNYYIEWDLKNRKRINSMKSEHAYESIHEREELDAAEALANLAFNSRQRMVNVQF